MFYVGGFTRMKIVRAWEKWEAKCQSAESRNPPETAPGHEWYALSVVSIQGNARNERNATQQATDAMTASNLAFWPLSQLRLLRTFFCSLRTLRCFKWKRRLKRQSRFLSSHLPHCCLCTLHFPWGSIRHIKGRVEGTLCLFSSHSKKKQNRQALLNGKSCLLFAADTALLEWV